MNDRKINVGFVDKGYSSDRNILNLNPEGVTFKRIYDFTLLHRALRKMGLKYRFGYEQVFSNYFKDFNLSPVDIVHLYNRVSMSNKPWVTTFETRIPYWTPKSKLEKKWFSKYGINLLENGACKKIIAISQNAYDLQLSYLQDKNALSDTIINKMTVLHPAQELIVQKWADKNINLDDTLDIILVGHQFFIKGGSELLTAVHRLLEEGKDINLTIVSEMLPYPDSIRSYQEDIDYANSIICKHPGNIRHLESLPNQKVLDLFKKSHLAMLPSYSETYGFAVLEAQAAGCPVVTTDIRALPENNNDQCGWLINVPKNKSGYAKIRTRKEKKIYSERLVSELYRIISEILEEPDLLKKKGNKAIDRIRKEHNPVEIAWNLGDIYREAFAAEAQLYHKFI